MKSNINTLRREEQIKNLIAQILYDINNADVINPTVMDCKLSNDLSHVKVYVTFEARSLKGIEALERAKGYVKTRIAKVLDWRKVPDIHFELDELNNSAMKIDSILQQIKNEE
ncbi:ribosome-binding factor A [Mycoplasmopsis columbina SF7]|uniref:Ribosome-binding factor A n=1 Tax=Mycoplasmopsis columbina SF7 TaxID=1037410 RepID=F9UKN9_9BACT|nr:30S ribosome-binding factor RbfA [Mycoplasmopsis columbina]EGV00244.1 ribosome-binding factor A [Mycoplasmopsis columbina SF7]